MDNKIELLDHGYIELIDHMGDDESIVRSARVSYAANEKTGDDSEGDAKLIHYLYKNGHNTPFESCEFQFRVKAPIFVIRQWHRHRTWSYNEVSARYTPLPNEFYIPHQGQITTQSTSNKQMRTDEVNPESVNIAQIMWLKNSSSYEAYQTLLDLGTPRELARTVLPVAMYTEMYAKVDLSNLFKFLTERCHSHAQYEIRVYANAILELIRPIVPIAIASFEEKFSG